MQLVRTVPEHVETPSLPFEPVPAHRIPITKPRPESTVTGADSTEGADAVKKPPPPRFTDYGAWVQQWLLPVTAVRIAAQHREGTYTWCRRWWEHHSVAVRFALLHTAFEAAVTAADLTALSSLFTRQIDPTMRTVLDAALLRPGRFDRTVVVDRPDIDGREAILRVHAKAVKKISTDVNLRKVAARTAGSAP